MATEVDDGYFNDLSRQPRTSNDSSSSPSEQNCTTGTYDQSELPKTKRIACVICRKRKLKCDGNRPKCATCARLGHNCTYDEVRKKSGPKRGYVKELEARLAQVETQLQGKAAKKDRPHAPERQRSVPEEAGMQDAIPEINQPMPQSSSAQMTDVAYSTMGSSNSPFIAPNSNMLPEAMTTSDFAPDMSFGLDDNFSWEMIGLGLEEPLPMQEAIDELTSAYFEKCHPFVPMLHKYRYYSSMSLGPQARPPVCLRYAMWCLAAGITEKYMHHQDIFYRRARKYIQLDEMKGSGEGLVSLAHAQAWVLVATYEFKNMYFPRAWMSVGRASRMVLMMGLNRIDGIGMDVKQCLPPPRDWTEREERRRTFWMAYCVDRYASIGTGWPMSIDERDIMTTLPASEEAYESDNPQVTYQLGEAMSHDQMASLSSFAGVVYVTHFFGMNLTHLHRPEGDEQEGNLQGKFWKRHGRMDNILSNTSMALPSHLRLPQGIRSTNVVFLNFAIHTSTICLHQAAIFKAERNNLPKSMVDNSRTRCLLAAGEIANIMRLSSHLDISAMNPFMAFCLYVAARVFVQYLKVAPSDTEIKTSLEFLLTAMAALRRKNPLSESFMIQLNLDIEGSGLDTLLHNPDFSSIVKDKVLPYQNCSGSPSEDQQGIPYLKETNNLIPGLPRTDGGGSDSSPSIRSESPRQTRYALGNIQLNAMDSRKMPSYFPTDVVSSPNGVEGILPPKTVWSSGDWSADTEILQRNQSAPVGMNPLINNNIANANGFDTDMGNHTGTSRNNSTGLSPQSSHGTYQSSSNTSYSPPQVQDEDPLTSVAATQSHANSIATTLDEAFKVPPGWDMNATGTTPGFTGMTPSGEWENMIRNMNWEGTGMTPK